MKQKKTSAQGDKIDLGGKLPQFDAFAWFAYRELAQNNLSWIRIADPEALKVDDIQYATFSPNWRGWACIFRGSRNQEKTFCKNEE